MSVTDHFDAFLDTTVNLKTWKLAKLDERVASILEALKADEVIGPMFREHIKQGSWAHQTIIEPVGDHDEFDADFLLHLSVNEDWGAEDRRKYLREVRAAFRRHSTYKDMVEKKNRCVRIKYANSCHVDVVPYLVIEDEDDRQVIINYKGNRFEDTNPEGLTAWMAERDEVTNGHFRAAVRLMKYLRDYKNTFDCKSVILTTLMGGRVQPVNRATRYADIPTTFISILEDLDAYLSEHDDEMPLIDDPSCPGTSFNHRWTEEKYQNFRSYISKYAEWAREARDSADEDGGVKAWQKMFGERFVAVEVREAAKTLQATRIRKSVLALRDDAAPREEFIEDKGYEFTPRYSATINGKVDTDGFRKKPIRTLRHLRRGLGLSFTLETDTPHPFEVLWKVRNHGEAATEADELRGEVISSNSSVAIKHNERTKYPGRHYVEAYVIKDGRVVASDHHDVLIE